MESAGDSRKTVTVSPELQRLPCHSSPHHKGRSTSCAVASRRVVSAPLIDAVRHGWSGGAESGEGAGGAVTTLCNTNTQKADEDEQQEATPETHHTQHITSPRVMASEAQPFRRPKLPPALVAVRIPVSIIFECLIGPDGKGRLQLYNAADLWYLLRPSWTPRRAHPSFSPAARTLARSASPAFAPAALRFCTSLVHRARLCFLGSPTTVPSRALLAHLRSLCVAIMAALAPASAITLPAPSNATSVQVALRIRPLNARSADNHNADAAQRISRRWSRASPAR